MFDPGIAFPHVRAGKVRMLAVAGAKRRPSSRTCRRWPSWASRDAELDIWFGMWAPNGTPADVTARMTKEIAKALARPTLKTRYESLGAEPVGLDNAEFKTLLADEAKMLSGLIKEAKINID